MLLCKQPGDPGVFATATSTKINIYRLSTSSELLQEGKDTSAGVAAATIITGEGLQSDGGGGVVNEWESTSAMGALNGASAYTAASWPSDPFQASATRKRPATPIHPSYSISLRQLCGGEESVRVATTSTDGTRDHGRVYMSSLQPQSADGRSRADDCASNVPLTLSLSCRREDTGLRFMYAGKTSGAWIGAENIISFLRTTATMTKSSSSLSVNETENDATYINHEAKIVASGWDPVDAVALVVGRRNGVVQLLNIENSIGFPKPTITTTNSSSNTVSPPPPVQYTSDITSMEMLHGLGNSGEKQSSTPLGSINAPSRSAEYSTLSASVVQQYLMKGAVTSLDWVPTDSHTVVVASEGLSYDGIGHRVGVMDLRSPDNGIRYLGMPFGTSVPNSSVNLSRTSSSIPICAELIACDYSGSFVATVGSQSHRDVAQLWDLRKTSKPVCLQYYSRAGYTSLCWSTCVIPTVIATTRSGGLRVHVFSDARSGTHNEEDAEDGAEGLYSDDDGGGVRTSYRSDYNSTFPSTVLRRETNPFEGRFRVQPRVPPASVLWLADQRSRARCMVGGNKTSEEKGGGQGKSEGQAQPVESGSCMDVPCLLLLNAKTGELYPQVFSQVGCKATIIDDFSLCSAGPNVFLLQTKCVSERVVAEHVGTSVNSNSMDGVDILNNCDACVKGEKGSLPLCSFPQSATTNSAGTIILPMNAVMDKTTLGITHVDRVSRRLSRLRAGFLPQPEKVLSILLKEQCDREAYVLFRYGWYVQQYMHPDKEALPAFDVAPGLLELLEREQNEINTATSKQTSWGVRKLVLCAMGWMNERRDEQLMLTSPQSLVSGGGGGDVMENTVKFPSRLISPTSESPPMSNNNNNNNNNNNKHRQLRDKSTAASPNSWSHTSGDEDVDATCWLSPSSHCYGIPPFLSCTSLEAGDLMEMSSLNEAVERRVAILVFMYRLKEASMLLTSYSNLNPLYSSFALVLLAADTQNCFPATLSLNVSGCSFWMELCFFFVVEFLTLPSVPTMSLVELEEEGYYGDHSKGGGEKYGKNMSDLYRFPLQARRDYFVTLINRFQQVPLSDRIALATLLFLSPSPSAGHKGELIALTEVLQEMVQQQFSADVVAGGCSLLLAAAVEGLANHSISLQHYVDETGDVQTPVVYVAMYGAARSTSWRLWNDAYRSQLNAGGHSLLRSLHDLRCKKMARLREQQCGPAAASDAQPPAACSRSHRSQPGDVRSFAVGPMGVPFGGLSAGAGAEAKAKRINKRSVELRCKCGKIVTSTPMEPARGVTAMGRRPQSLGGCNECLTPMCAVCGEKMFALASGYDVESSFTWCTVCLHGGHLSHLRDWFAKHRTCPADDCLCPCYCSSLP